MPAYLYRGATFSGPVVYVADGDGFCVDVGGRLDPNQWVEVRLADFYAKELHEPGGVEARADLVRLARGKRATCTANKQSYDRVVAVCRINGASIGASLKASGERQGGRAWNGSR